MTLKRIFCVTIAVILTAAVSPSIFLEAAALQTGSTTSIEDSPVWRVQLVVSTANTWGGPTVGWSGTNNVVDVRLNWENFTRLHSSFNNVKNFEAGSTYTYDLILDNVRKLRDIQMIQLFKPGDDSWCIQGLTLLVNGRAIYDVDFPGNGQWMGTNAYLYRISPDLRAHPLWRSYTPPSPPQAIWASHLISTIDGQVGDYIKSGDLGSGKFPALHYWRPAGENTHSVRVNGNGSRMIHVELDLQYWYVGVTYRVDLEFDLEFSCGGGKIFVQTRNLDMSGYPYHDSVTLANRTALMSFFQMALPTRLLSAFHTVTYTNEFGQATCPPVRVVGNSVYLW